MTIREVIERHGHFAHGGNSDDTAEAWAEAGFKADEVEEWLNARCLDPSIARDMADAGVPPADARIKTEATVKPPRQVASQPRTEPLIVLSARDIYKYLDKYCVIPLEVWPRS